MPSLGSPGYELQVAQALGVKTPTPTPSLTCPHTAPVSLGLTKFLWLSSTQPRQPHTPLILLL